MTTEFCKSCKHYRRREEKDNLGSVSVYESCLLNDKIAYPIKYIESCKSYEAKETTRKLKLKHTLVLEVDSDDYDIKEVKRGKATDCAWCPFFKSSNNHTRAILEANHMKCCDAFEKVFGGECTRLKITRKK